MAEGPGASSRVLPPAGGSAAAGRWYAPILAAIRRWPFASLFLLIVLSNLAGSYFNIAYNGRLIVRHHMSEAQRDVFWRILVPAYNLAAYGASFAIMLALFWPLAACRRDLRAGLVVEPARMDRCRRRLVLLPTYQVALNLLLWLPGAVLFPLGICLLGGWEGAGYIGLQFAISFTLSALLTTLQTFFLVEAFLIEVLYPEFFRAARPADVRGTVRVPMAARLALLWTALAAAPVLALLAVVLNISAGAVERLSDLRSLAIGVAVVGLPSSAFLMWMVGRNLLAWTRSQAAATESIASGDYTVRIREQRPDEWGQLTDRFNDMAEALENAQQLRETFGQFVSPDVRDEILKRHPGLGGEVAEVTVLFADMRGSTRRSAGVEPTRAVELLNRFLSLAVAAVEENGGWVNKFLGDGVMALFGAPRPLADHADAALAAARGLAARLEALNRELGAQGGERLDIGIGIHTGPALVGCIGASIDEADGTQRVRREFTAIGDTVNACQRIEQLTKTLGGRILLSEETRRRLASGDGLAPVGLQTLTGFETQVLLYRLEA